MSDIKISIITASYNYQDYIAETIESVIAQTYPNWELIIVDDGSTDKSVDIIKSYCAKDNRIKLFQHKNAANKGLKNTLLLGLQNASSDWIAFLESDDIWACDYLEQKVSVIKENPDVKFIFNDVELFGDPNSIEKAKEFVEPIRQLLSTYSYPMNFLKIMNENKILTFSVVMFHKDVLKDVSFNCPVKPILDYYLWLQIAQKFDFYYINKQLTKWRMHANSYMSETKKISKKRYFLFKLYRQKFLMSGRKKHLYYLYNTGERFKFYLKGLIKKLVSK